MDQDREISVTDTMEMVHKIAAAAAGAGGRVYYVGGCVRDRMMGELARRSGDACGVSETKDIDIEVHGLEPEQLLDILGTLGEPLSFGDSFGVYSLRGWDIDIAMPRRERATGPLTGARGHRDFEIDVDPFLGTYQASKRRDFTVNALMEDVLTGEVIDHFGGTADLENRIIRHVDPATFPEDPLRVLRAAQFAARFGFDVAPETIELCKTIDLSALPRERVEGELRKALLQAEKPSIFFEVLREMDQLRVWFPELEQLIGLEQDPVFHPEGDVWVHTMESLDRGAAVRDRTSDPFAFMMLVLTHDLGKIVTTEFVKGRIHSYEHEIKGVPLAEGFVSRITGNRHVLEYVTNMVPLHMRPNMAAYAKSSLKSTNKMFDAAIAPEDLIYFAMADRPLWSGNDPFTGDSDFLFDRLRVYRDTMEGDYIMGSDLIEAGFEPGEYFGEVLEYAHKLRLAGISRDEAIRQVIPYARKLLKKQKNERV